MPVCLPLNIFSLLPACGPARPGACLQVGEAQLRADVEAILGDMPGTDLPSITAKPILKKLGEREREGREARGCVVGCVCVWWMGSLGGTAVAAKPIRKKQGGDQGLKAACQSKSKWPAKVPLKVVGLRDRLFCRPALPAEAKHGFSFKARKEQVRDIAAVSAGQPASQLAS